MALVKQLIPYAFTTGLDSKTNPQLTQELTAADNVVYLQTGNLQKRNGYAALSTSIVGGGTVATPSALETYGNELMAFASQTAYSYSSALSKWASRGNCFSLNVTKTDIERNSAEQTAGDCNTLNGVTVYAYESSTGLVLIKVIDETTGAVITSGTAGFGNNLDVCPKVVVLGSYIYVVTLNQSGAVYVNKIDPTAPTISAATQIISDASNSVFCLDVVSVSANGTLVVAYVKSSVFVKIVSVLPSLVVGTGSNGAPAPVTTALPCNSCVSAALNGTNLFITAHSSGSGLVYAVYGSTTFSAVQAIQTVESNGAQPNTVAGITGVPSSTSIVIYYTVSNSTAINTLIKSVTLPAGTFSGTPAVFLRSVGLASKAFFTPLGYCFVTAFSSTIQPTYFVVRASDGAVVYRGLSGTAGGLPARRALPEGASPDGTKVFVALTQKAKLQAAGGTVYAYRSLIRLLLDPSTAPYSTRVLSKTLLSASGLVQSYDGTYLTEHGFHVYPEGISATQAVTESGIAAGTYLYKAIYEWTDARGQVHQSATSVAYSYTVAANSTTVTATVPTLRLTAKPHSAAGVLITLYRTQASGTVYYKIGSVTNDPTVDTLTIDDEALDGNIIGNQLLYTTGNVLDNDPSQPSSVSAVFDDRVWLASAENPTQLYFSQTAVDGAALQFSDFLSVTLDSSDGVITALAKLDDKFIVFKKTAIWYFTGSGPSTTGDNSGYSTPTQLPTDVGCISQKSVVLTPQGLMFQSEKGIYLLDRALQVAYLGAAADQFNGLAVVRGTLIDSKHQVRFLTSNDKCVVYNYFQNKWTDFTAHSGADATMWLGSYCYVNTSAGAVWQESTGFGDPTGTVSQTITTEWFKPSQLQGFARVYRATVLGVYKGAHTLQVQVGYDFKSTYDQTVTFTPSSGDNQYQYQVQLSQQKCEAVRFTITVTPTGGANECCSLTGITLEVGQKPGTMRLPASQKS